MKDIPVVGEALSDDEWLEVKKDMDDIKSCSMEVIKILNYKGGSTKFIAKILNGVQHAEARRKLEDAGWQMGTPYHSRGSIVGFRVSKIQHAIDVNAWGG